MIAVAVRCEKSDIVAKLATVAASFNISLTFTFPNGDIEKHQSLLHTCVQKKNKKIFRLLVQMYNMN
jgi:hypothetical protein